MRILTINSGSSSIKFSLYRMGPQEELALMGSVDGIGFTSGTFRIRDGSGKQVLDRKLSVRDHAAALKEIAGRLAGGDLDAVGHRIVHGGGVYAAPHQVTPELMAALHALVPFAPDHLPHEIDAVREIKRLYPGIPQVACFDTAFHRTMPERARLYALPEEVRGRGVVRYGFHGLSYEYIMDELGKEAGRETADGRVIVAHLGNGASMAAFRNSRSMDTTMGFTPAGGLMMSTRSGDLDPGVTVYLLREMKMDAAGLNRLVNKESGLAGVSGTSPDMKELLQREKSDRRAAAAVGLFCYQGKKFLGGLAAALGGLDTLVFTGGIGEHAAPVRERICGGLEFLGIRVDGEKNRINGPVISPETSTVTVRVMRTNEELMIARHTFAAVRST